MNTREKIKADNLKEKETFLKQVEDYSTNQKLHYSAMENELTTIIRNTIPTQLNSLRTLMWVNIVFLGLAIQLKSISISFFILLFFVTLCLGLSFGMEYL